MSDKQLIRYVNYLLKTVHVSLTDTLEKVEKILSITIEIVTGTLDLTTQKKPARYNNHVLNLLYSTPFYLLYISEIYYFDMILIN